MISAKLAALCLCPTLVATPIVVATHPKIRHAVAHMMHRAADRLEAPRASSPVQLAAAPCAPGVSPGSLSAGSAAPLLSDFGSAGPGVDALSIPLADVSGNGVSALNIGRTNDGGLDSRADIIPAGITSPNAGLGIAPAPVAGVTEPQNWALLMTGFGATGILLRARRSAA